MRALPLSQKKYLVLNNQASRSKPGHQPSYSASYSPATAAALMPRLVPQLTGDASFLRRFSISNWGPPAQESSERTMSSPPRVASPTAEPANSPLARAQSPMREEPAPLKPQTTGGLWASWWNSSGGDSRSASSDKTKKEVDNSAKSYVVAIQSCKVPDMKLVKSLINLRVHLSTAKLAFIEDFVVTEQGLQVLGDLLATMVGKSGKRKRLTEVETTALVELIKCFRVLLNTEVRCSKVFVASCLSLS